MTLFEPALTTAAMASAVSDRQWLRAIVRFESELAATEAALGLIPAAAADAIAAACDSVELDAAAIGAEAVVSSTPVLPVLSALRPALPKESRAHLHYGATSQDALDTAAMLVSASALEVLDRDLHELGEACAHLAETHANDVVIGRTLMRPARPTTFGLKAAGWLIAVDEVRARLVEFGRRRLSVQLGGAAGSLDVLGVEGTRVADELARRLNLAPQVLPWHSDRTRIAELAGLLATAAGASAKIALDVILLSQAEVGEVEVTSLGESSAMPEKRNPVRAIEARAANARLLGVVPALLGAMAVENERAAGAWQAEWSALADAFRFTAGAVAGARDSVTGLEVDVARMRSNAHDAESPPAAQELVHRALEHHRATARERKSNGGR